MRTDNLDKYDCYSILGITHNAEIDEIKRAYRKLALQYHPDRNKSEDATAIFTVIQRAYDTLVDSGKRKRYNSTLPALASKKETKIKVVLEGAFTPGHSLDDRAAISIMSTDEAIVFENSATVPTIWIHTHDLHKQYSLFTNVAFERLFRALYAINEPNETLDDIEFASENPELRAHFDGRFWNRGQTNVSLYCYSSMSFTIINGLPYLNLHGARYRNSQREITMELYAKMRQEITRIIHAELEGTVDEQAPKGNKANPVNTLFQPIGSVQSLQLPPRQICFMFTDLCRTKSVQEGIDMLSKVYGITPMKTVFQHRFPINDMVCKDALAVYYSSEMTAYFKPEGTTMATMLHEFYHHLVYCYGATDQSDYQLLPDQVTGYYARNEREEAAADSYAKTFLRRAMG